MQSALREIDGQPRAAVGDQPLQRVHHVVDASRKRGHVAIPEDSSDACRPVDRLLQRRHSIVFRSGHGGTQPDPRRQVLISIHLAGDELDERVASEAGQERLHRIDGYP
ncbi:MAG: hypothetical protein L0227_01935 [Chloroflexi bacterium]|nr:hypothetical protein [Chloroflexota bacterium]